MYKTWTESEKQFVINNAQSKTDGELYKELKEMGATHTISSVRKFRQRNALAKKAGRPPKNKVIEVKKEENNGGISENVVVSPTTEQNQGVI